MAVRSSTYSAQRSGDTPMPSSLGTTTTSTPRFASHWPTRGGQPSPGPAPRARPPQRRCPGPPPPPPPRLAQPLVARGGEAQLGHDHAVAPAVVHRGGDGGERG